MEFSLAGRSTSRWQSTVDDRDSTETESEPDGKDADRKGGQGRQARVDDGWQIGGEA